MSERCCTRCGDGDLYPRRCSQCGKRWADSACGPTHALIAEELGLGDLRRELIRLHSWDGLMEVLGEHYPPDVVDGSSGDPGPQIVALARALDEARHEQHEAYGERDGAMNNVEALDALLAEAQQNVTKLDRMRSYLATQVLGHPPEEAAGIPDKELLWRVAFWAKQGQDAARERLKESGRPLTKEELLAEFADMEQRRSGGPGTAPSPDPFLGHEAGIARRAPDPRRAPRHALRQENGKWVTVCSGSPATPEDGHVLRHPCPKCSTAVYRAKGES